MLKRLLSSAMASDAVLKRVPIPPRGVDYRGKVVLAPMVRSGELPSRLLALHYGADLVWGALRLRLPYASDTTHAASSLSLSLFLLQQWVVLTFPSSLGETWQAGPETIDRAMIGTTRRFNAATQTIDFTRATSNQLKKAKAAAAAAEAAEQRPPADRDVPESTIFRIDPGREGGRLVFQLGTSDPGRAVAAARLVAGDVAGIDVNAGCPKPFSTSGGMGAALLRTPDLLCAILEALVRDVGPAFGVGVSVKIRLLETAEATAALVRRLVGTGITGLTVHCRTAAMRKRERAVRGQLRMVAGICRAAGVACLVNGDVESRDEALRLAAEYGADGAMIATAAETNPSCFRAGADGGMDPWRDAVRRYVGLAAGVANKFGNTKFLLGQMVPGKVREYRELNKARSYTAVCQMLGFEDLLAVAAEADAYLGLPSGAGGGLQAAKSSNSSALAAGGNMAETRRKPAGPKARNALAERGAQAPPLAEKESMATPVQLSV
jgi:tRNA-dihydrouridine synthase 2